MTKNEFLQRRKLLGSESPPHDTAAAIAMGALAFLGIPIGFHTPKPYAFFYIALMLCVCISYMVYAARWNRRTGLLCGACHRPLLNRAADLALSTGVCPRCHKQAFE
jgi:hypothetical protein